MSGRKKLSLPARIILCHMRQAAKDRRQAVVNGWNEAEDLARSLSYIRGQASMACICGRLSEAARARIVKRAERVRMATITRPDPRLVFVRRAA